MEQFVSWRDVTYRPIRRLGKGGVGRVYLSLATDGPNKGILFAVKVFHPDSPLKRGWQRAFMREVHVLRDCSHPAIVRVFDEGVLSDGRPFFVMDYLAHDLKHAMEEKQLDDTAKVGIVMQALSALDYLSRRDPYVVHRDIKPTNIFLKDNNPILGDFGLVFQDVVTSNKGRVATGIPEMAQMYRTPELVEYHNSGTSPPTVSDVFQMGLVACELFTGQNPLKQRGRFKPVEIEPLNEIPGNFSEIIKARLEEMLVVPTEARKPASKLLPLWIGLYRTVAGRAKSADAENK